MDTSNWRTITDEFRARIDRGELVAGDRLPSSDDIAESWNVSRHTANRAIEELQKTGYVVRQRRWGTVVAGSIASPRRTAQVALLSDRIASRYNFPSSELIAGIREGLGDDYDLILTESKDDPAVEARELARIQREMDGAILYPTTSPQNIDLYEQMFRSEFPLVLLDRYPENVHVDAVVSDSRGATESVLSTLRSRGHERIGFFSFYKPDFSSITERYGAYLAMQPESSPEDANRYVRWFPRELELQHQWLVQSAEDALFALTKCPNPITALFCVEDGLAAAVLQASDHIGISIPIDLELGLFNDWPPMMHRRPWVMHRIVQQTYEIGRRAGQRLRNRMNGPLPTPEVIRVEAEIFLPEATYGPTTPS